MQHEISICPEVSDCFAWMSTCKFTSWILTVSETDAFTLSGRKKYKVGITMGLYFGIHASHSHSVV